MAERLVPVDGKRADWPRIVAEIVNRLGLRVATVESLTDWSLLADYADDTAAATGGVAIGSLYRTGSQVKIRVS